MFRACLILGAVTALLLGSTASGQDIRFLKLPADVIQQRLSNHPPKDADRETELNSLFAVAGCTADHLSEQPVKHEKLPNVICVLPGETNEEIVVGAHYDHVPAGEGVIDNWSGASLLPSLLQSLVAIHPRHTFVFISFTGEEDGLYGSTFYAGHLQPGERERIQAMVNLDTLALGPTEVWASRSDKKLVQEARGLAAGMKFPLYLMNVDQVGESDEEPFVEKKVPTITFHTVTSKTFPWLHTKKDNMDAVQFQDYYQTYQLLAGYLALIDHDLETPPTKP